MSDIALFTKALNSLAQKQGDTIAAIELQGESVSTALAKVNDTVKDTSNRLFKQVNTDLLDISRNIVEIKKFFLKKQLDQKKTEGNTSTADKDINVTRVNSGKLVKQTVQVNNTLKKLVQLSENEFKATEKVRTEAKDKEQKEKEDRELRKQQLEESKSLKGKFKTLGAQILGKEDPYKDVREKQLQGATKDAQGGNVRSLSGATKDPGSGKKSGGIIAAIKGSEMGQRTKKSAETVKDTFPILKDLKSLLLIGIAAFSGLLKFIPKLLKGIVKFGRLIGKLGRVLGRFAAKMFRVAGRFLRAVGRFAKKAFAFIGRFLKAVGRMARTIGKSIAKVITNILSKIPGISKFFKPKAKAKAPTPDPKAKPKPKPSGATKATQEIAKKKIQQETAEATAKAAASSTTKAVAKSGGKTLVKSGLKKIPLVGALFGIGFGLQRAFSGDFAGAALEVASGVTGAIPGVGTAASAAIDVGLAARDIHKATSGLKSDMDSKAQEMYNEKPMRKVNPDGSAYDSIPLQGSGVNRPNWSLPPAPPVMMNNQTNTYNIMPNNIKPVMEGAY